MTRWTIFCLLVCLLLAAAELAAVDLVYSSSPKLAPLCLGLILLATGGLASLGYVWARLTILVRRQSVAMAHRAPGRVVTVGSH